MRAIFIRYVIAAAMALAIACPVAGCHDGGEDHPFYEFAVEHEVDTDTESDQEQGTDDPPDSDTDPCPPDYVDEYGRCIRFVNWVSTTSACGTSWDGAFDNIQDGIDSAYESAQILGECEVWVATGLYSSYEGDPMDTFRLKKGVHLFGGFAAFETERSQRDVEANETVLTGSGLLGQGNSYHVLMGAEDAIIDGFTITGGDAIGDPPHHRGGGIYLNSANTRVSACTLRRNRAVDGGAIFAYDGSPSIKSCTFAENHAERGGGLYVLNGAPTIRSVTVEHNVATDNGGGIYIESVFGGCNPWLEEVDISGNVAWEDGGGLYNANCSVSMEDVLIAGNKAGGDGGGFGAFRGATYFNDTLIEGNEALGSGGGVMSNDNETVFTASEIVSNTAAVDGGGAYLAWTEGSFESCLVSANAAGESGGGFYVEMDFPAILNTRITGNTAYAGGGIYSAARGDPDVINCVVHGNRAEYRGGGLFNDDLSEVYVANSILWMDEQDEIHDVSGSSTVVTYSTVDGGYPGVYVFGDDPLFVVTGHWDDQLTGDPADDEWVDGDYHLQPGSPCIDVANDTVSPTCDADGNAWEDVTDVGFPSAATDQGSYDCKI